MHLRRGGLFTDHVVVTDAFGKAGTGRVVGSDLSLASTCGAACPSTLQHTQHFFDIGELHARSFSGDTLVYFDAVQFLPVGVGHELLLA